MAKRRRSNRGRSKRTKLQPAVTDLSFKTTPTEAGISHLWYVDTARALSRVNRRGYSQSRMYAFQRLTFIWKQNAANLATLEVKVATAGNTWIVHNAHVKGHALWNQMNELVLEDNPSIQGKWADFKIQLSTSVSDIRTLNVLDGGGTAYKAGEWDSAKFVMPQHRVTEDAPGSPTSSPLPAEEFTAVLIGGDSLSKRSLVQAYQESRATVQPTDPNVPPGMSTSFFNLLTDSGSQEPELADVIEGANDNPPYDTDEYPGSDTNVDTACIVGYGAISPQEVDGRIGGFVAPCGLVEIQIKGFNAAGVVIADADMPEIELLLHVAPGMYKGVASVPMGQ